MLCLTADGMPYAVELRIGYGTFMKMRVAFLERFDELMKMSLHHMYEMGLKNRVRLAEDPEFKKEFFNAWNEHISEISLKTRFLREYKVNYPPLKCRAC